MSRKVWLTAEGRDHRCRDGGCLPPFQPAKPDGLVTLLRFLLVVDPAPLVVETKTGQQSYTIEIADREAERERGLMFRETMDDGHGMLFVFEATQQVAFWMRNTPLPLDMVFIGQDGIVSDIRYGEPMSETIVEPPVPVRFVLELKAGIAEKADIKRGDRIRHPAIDKVTGAAD
jgi:uncharacterized membrane protein (UPF0127 family)